MDRLANLKKELKDRLVEGADLALKHLAEAIAADSPKFNIFIQLRSRYSAYLSAIMVGGSTSEELEKVYNHITSSFLSFVDSLTINDLKPETPAAAPARPKRGELLYHIPHSMQQDREHACRVRVAYLLDDLFAGWQEQPEQVQRSIRVAEIMAVEMLNIDESQPFAIRTFGETIQFLEAGEPTEWVFYVRPLRSGAFPLLLKVSVIEVINGREVRKDVVIEEHIIVSNAAVAVPEVLKKSGVEVSLQSVENQKVGMPKGAPPPQPAAQPKPKNRTSKPLRAAALFLAFLMFSTVGTFAMTSEIQRGYWLASFHDTEKSYSDFISKFENDPDFAAAPQREKAYFRRAVLSEEPLVVRKYLEKFPSDLTYEIANRRERVHERLNSLEIKAVAAIEADPTTEKIEKYTRDFPEMRRIEQVARAAESRPAVATDALPILERAAVQQIQRDTADVEKAKIYRQALPASEPVRLEIERRPSLQNAVFDASGSHSDFSKNENLSAGGGRGGSKISPSNNPQPVENQKVENPPAEPQKHNRRSGFEMVQVAGGTFTMGDDIDIWDDNCEHKATVKSFSIGKYEVTQADWREVMGSNPEELEFKGCDFCPVQSVSWIDVQEFLKKANEKFPGKNYRPPTEAEWEFAARGGNASKKFDYAGSNDLNEVGWFTDNSGSKTHPVGSKKANELGIFDMSGNVWEWCEDTWKPYSCDLETKADSSRRCLRGGSWLVNTRSCRVANRLNFEASLRSINLGFRLAQD